MKPAGVAVIAGSRQADMLIGALGKLDIPVDPAADTVVIAPHPFDTDIIACAMVSTTGKQRLLLQRDPWVATSDDTWFTAVDAGQAAGILSDNGYKRALIAVGNTRLLPFYHLENTYLLVRSRNAPHPPLPPNGGIEQARGPFTVEHEIDTFQTHKIDVLVAHNAGGEGGWPKLAAARALHLPVILIERPELPKIRRVNTVEAAIDWIISTPGLDLLPPSP